MFNFLVDVATSGSIITTCNIIASGANLLTSNMLFTGSPANATGSWAVSGSFVANCTASTYGLGGLSWTGGGTTGTILSNYSFFQATRIG